MMHGLLRKPGDQVVELTADVVAAYVSNNPVPAGDLPGLIAAVHSSLKKLGAPRAAQAEPAIPPLPIKKTITHDYLISLEDGKQYQTLKRHLGIMGLTPDEYRAKWSLPRDYPMVAAAYSKKRSELAKTLGLGRKAGKKSASNSPGQRAKASG
jgi:predicted transcriptional regulator